MAGDELDTGFVMQQLSSPGQNAFVSTSSQNRASRPLTHSPWHCLAFGGILVAIAFIVGIDVVDVVELGDEGAAACVAGVEAIGMK